MSKCGKCNGMSFKIVEQSPLGSAFKLMFVQCSSCNVPIGAMEYFNSGAKVEEQTKELKKDLSVISKQISSLEQSLRVIANSLQGR